MKIDKQLLEKKTAVLATNCGSKFIKKLELVASTGGLEIEKLS